MYVQLTYYTFIMKYTVHALPTCVVRINYKPLL